MCEKKLVSWYICKKKKNSRKYFKLLILLYYFSVLCWSIKEILLKTYTPSQISKIWHAYKKLVCTELRELRAYSVIGTWECYGLNMRCILQAPVLSNSGVGLLLDMMKFWHWRLDWNVNFLELCFQWLQLALLASFFSVFWPQRHELFHSALSTLLGWTGNLKRWIKINISIFIL